MSIYITGGAGFIGSNVVRILNGAGISPIVIDTITEEKFRNLSGLSFTYVETEKFRHDRAWKRCWSGNYKDDTLIHLGANVDTTEPFNDKLWANNVTHSLDLFKDFGKVIYASSGSVYGAEEKDFSERIYGLKQLNAYGFSKWALDEAVFGIAPQVKHDKIYALRFFNVYGPNETHKGNMQSVVSKAIHKLKPLYVGTTPTDSSVLGLDLLPRARQALKRKGLSVYSLFKSDRPDVGDGEQKRDFVYVDDVANVILWLVQNEVKKGIYNLGSGVARSFNDLVRAVDQHAVIQYVPMPDVLKKSYQYFTQANLTALRSAGYDKPFTSLEEGIRQTLALTFPKSPHTVEP